MRISLIALWLGLSLVCSSAADIKVYFSPKTQLVFLKGLGGFDPRTDLPQPARGHPAGQRD